MFITFEGPDGAGKTTVSTAIAQKMKASNYQVIFTHEPGGTEISEDIRKIILHKGYNPPMAPWTEALLYIASRVEHTKKVIIPALKQNKIVICDRFTDSSVVYQGYGRHLPPEQIAQIQTWAIGKLEPDCTIFLDLPPEIGQKRLQQRGTATINRLDQEKLSFHQTVYNGYQALIKANPQRFIVIDAAQELSAVIEQTYDAIIKRLK